MECTYPSLDVDVKCLRSVNVEAVGLGCSSCVEQVHGRISGRGTGFNSPHALDVDVSHKMLVRKRMFGEMLASV